MRPGVLDLLRKELEDEKERLREHREQAQAEQKRAALRLVYASNSEARITDLERAIQLLEANHGGSDHSQA